MRERSAIDDTDAAAAQISCALAVSHGRAIGLIDLALTLRDRLPKTGARYLDGQITSSVIAAIAYATFLVSGSALSAVDTAIAERAPRWGALSDQKLREAINVWVDRYDPDAVRRTRNALRHRYFAVGDRSDQPDGTVSVHGRLSATDAALTHQRLAAMISRLCPDDPRTADQRRADAVGAAMAGSQFLACICDMPDCPAGFDDGRATNIVVHVIADHDALHAEPDPDMHGDTRPTSRRDHEPTTEPAGRPASALIPGIGIVPAPLLAELIARGATIRPVDAATLAAEPRYRPSAALQRFVRTRDMTCRFPGCDRPAITADIDHTQPWPTGLTHPANTKCYCRRHHLIKTFLHSWADRQHPDGTVEVITPAGIRYTTKPLSGLLFPSWNTTTPPPRAPTARPTPTGPGRQAVMPSRRHTRAQSRAAYVTRERKLNAAERATTNAAGTPAATPDHGSDYPTGHSNGRDYSNDPPPS